MNYSLCLPERGQDIIGLIFSAKDLDWEKLYTSKGNYNRIGS